MAASIKQFCVLRKSILSQKNLISCACIRNRVIPSLNKNVFNQTNQLYITVQKTLSSNCYFSRPYSTSSDNKDTSDQVKQTESNNLDIQNGDANLSHNEEVPLITDEEVQLSQSDKELHSSPFDGEMEPSHENEIFTIDLEEDVLYQSVFVEVKGHDKAVLNSYNKFVQMVTQYLDLDLHKVMPRKTHYFRQSVLKSVHIYKKHFSQYEQRTYFLEFHFKHMTGSTANTVLEYLQRNLPEGVAMKVTKEQIERLPPHIRPPVQKETTTSPSDTGAS